MLTSFVVTFGREGESETKIIYDKFVKINVWTIIYSLHSVEKHRESEKGKTTCFKIEATQK